MTLETLIQSPDYASHLRLPGVFKQISGVYEWLAKA
jgi:hypothetical protein